MPIVQIDPKQEKEPQRDGARHIDLPIIPFPLKQVADKEEN
jgi:hypothetical protein